MTKYAAQIAFAVLLALLAGCASPTPSATDPLIAQMTSSARVAYDRGVYPQASRFYEQALRRARALDDAAEIARNAYNLAACKLILGQPSAARPLLAEALVEFERRRMDLQPVLLLDAKAALALGDTNECSQILDRAFARAKSDEPRAQIWALRGDIAVTAGDRAAAAAALQELEKLRAPRALAATHQLAGRVALMNETYGEAARRFSQASDEWKRDGQWREMATALAAAASAFEQSGDHRAAADAAYRAARSFAGQGDTVSALKAVDQGLAANSQANNAELQNALTALFNQLQSDVKASK